MVATHSDATDDVEAQHHVASSSVVNTNGNPTEREEPNQDATFPDVPLSTTAAENPEAAPRTTTTITGTLSSLGPPPEAHPSSSSTVDPSSAAASTTQPPTDAAGYWTPLRWRKWKSNIIQGIVISVALGFWRNDNLQLQLRVASYAYLDNIFSTTFMRQKGRKFNEVSRPQV